MASSQALLASKIVILEEAPRNIVFPSIPTAVLGLVGITERGPFGATLVTSFNEYVKVFGSFTATADVAIGAFGFFLNGGTTNWIARVVHLTDVLIPSSKISVAATAQLLATATPVGDVNGKTDGTYANGFDAVVSAATSGVAAAFNLTIQDQNDVILEVFPNLVVTPTTDPRFWETIVNDPNTGSDFVAINDLAVGTRPDDQSVALATGDDGLTGLADTDYTGSAASAEPKTGVHQLDNVENLTLLAIPGRATSAVANKMLTYCETDRKGQVFAILDPPAATTASGMVTYVKTTAAIQGISNFGAIYWPRIKIINPDPTVFTSDERGLITVPPSGFICGAAARGDASREGGIYHNFAGLQVDGSTSRGQLIGAVALETKEVEDEAKRDLIYPELINPISIFSGAPVHVDGTKTLREDVQFPTIAQRRGASFIQRVIKQGLQFVRHANITDDLLREAARVANAFLLGETRKGAFVTNDPTAAFFVDFSPGLNPPSSRLAKTVNGRIGLAFAEPADFVIIIFGKDSRQFDEELAAAGLT